MFNLFLCMDGEKETMKQTRLIKKIWSVTILSTLMAALLGHAAYAKSITPNPGNAVEFSPFSSQVSPFKDIKGHWAESIIVLGYEKGYIDASSTNRFKPDDAVTRKQFFTMLVKALELPLIESFEENVYVHTAKMEGLFQEEMFPYSNWEEPLRKHQLAHISVRALESSKNIQDDMYDAISLGLISGTSNGKLEPAVKTTRAQAAVVIDRILRVKQGEKLPVDQKALKAADKVKLNKKDPWGRAIRTTNLPKNAKDFPYILEEWPNEMYELNHSFKSYHTNITPAAFTDLRSYANQDYVVYNTDHLVEWVELAETYISHLINVDYTKLDKNWMKPIKETVNPRNSDHMDRQLNDTLGTYITAAKKNKTKVTGGIVKAEPSIVFVDGQSYMRIYFTFKATSFSDQSHLFYDPSPKFGTHLALFKSITIKKNVEYEVFANLGFINTSNNGGLLTDNTISFSAFLLNDAIIREKK